MTSTNHSQLRQIRKFRHKRGSATFEYTIVSTFAVFVSVAALTFVGRMFKTRVQKLAEHVGMEATELDIDLGLE